MIEIPAERLPSETLSAVIEEYVLREGTDYGVQEISLQSKIKQVQGCLLYTSPSPRDGLLSRMPSSA